MKIIATLLFLALLGPTQAFAFSLTPTPGDQSILYLGEIFGQVGNLLNGSGSAFIGQIFRYGNFAILLLGSVLITYTLFMSVINTANDGKMMGERWSSIWVPLRTVLGIALLIPKASGYNALQWIVMWVVIQGIGVADSVWDMAVSKLFHGSGSLDSSTIYVPSAENQSLYDAAGNLLRAQVCVNTINKIYTGSANFSCQVIPAGVSQNEGYPEYQISCGGTLTPNGASTPINFTGACGTVTPDYSSIDLPNYNVTGTFNEGDDPGVFASVRLGLLNMMATLQPTAQAITNNVYQYEQSVSSSTAPVSGYSFGANTTQTYTNIPSNAISDAVAAYQNVVDDALSQYREKASTARVQSSSIGTNPPCTPAQVQAAASQLKSIGQAKRANFNTWLNEDCFYDAYNPYGKVSSVNPQNPALSGVSKIASNNGSSPPTEGSDNNFFGSVGSIWGNPAHLQGVWQVFNQCQAYDTNQTMLQNTWQSANASQRQAAIAQARSIIQQGEDEAKQKFQNENQCSLYPEISNSSTTKTMEDQGWFDAGWYYLTLAETSFLKSSDRGYASYWDGSGGGHVLQFDPPSLNSTGVNASAFSPYQSNNDGGTGDWWSPYADATNAYINADSEAFSQTGSTTPPWIEASKVSPLIADGYAKPIIDAVNAALDEWGVMFNLLSGSDQGSELISNKVSNTGTKIAAESSTSGLTTNAQTKLETTVDDAGSPSVRASLSDPLLLLQSFGHDLVKDAQYGFGAEATWFSNAANANMWKSVLSNLWGSYAADKMITAMWYLPLGGTMLAMMISSGIMLEIYVPLIPFILFTLGGIGWLLAVIQAMVAAPIVCFGIMHPNAQNELMGKSEPAVMLLVNIFLRPTLMLFGLLFGISLIYICVNIIDTGFAHMMTSMISFSSVGALQDPFSAISLISIYTLFLVLVIQKCFSLISIIPDGILSWIQGGEAARQQFGAMDGVEQQLQSKVGSGASQMGQAAQQTSSQQAQGEGQVAGNNRGAIQSAKGTVGSVAKGVATLALM